MFIYNYITKIYKTSPFSAKIMLLLLNSEQSEEAVGFKIMFLNLFKNCFLVSVSNVEFKGDDGAPTLFVPQYF